MATQSISLSGVARWFKHDDVYKRWTIDLYMDAPSFEKFHNSGLQVHVRTDKEHPEWGEYAKFARRDSQIISGDIVKFEKPDVFFNGQKFEGSIGNDSIVTIKVAVFDSIKGKGHRLESVTIDRLVEYVKPKADQAFASFA